MARIYSQPVPYNPYGGQLSSRPMEALRGSLPYKQTDWRGRQRMESLVSMRLPAQSDITQVRQVGKRYDNVPIYSAPMHQPWGKFGSIGMDREREKSKPLSSGGGGSQPAQQPSLPPVLPERSLGISSPSLLPFTGFGRITGESPFRTPTIPKETPSPLPRGAAGAISSPLGIPRFPFANY